MTSPLFPPLTLGLLRQTLVETAKLAELSKKIDAGDYDADRDGSLFDIIVVPLGKKLGDCTAREAGAAGEWYTMIAERFGDKTWREIVVDHLSGKERLAT